MVFWAVGLHAAFRSTAYEQMFARDYELLMPYDTHYIADSNCLSSHLEGRPTTCASPHTVEHRDIDESSKYFRSGGRCNVKILSYNPGHDGAVAFLQDAHLVICIEAEKDSNARHSPISIA